MALHSSFEENMAKAIRCARDGAPVVFGTNGPWLGWKNRARRRAIRGLEFRLPRVIVDWITTFEEFIDADYLAQQLCWPIELDGSWYRNVIMMSIGTNNFDLFQGLHRVCIHWYIWDEEQYTEFAEFGTLPTEYFLGSDFFGGRATRHFVHPRDAFIETATKVLRYCGRDWQIDMRRTERFYDTLAPKRSSGRYLTL